jgi:hypothetical protein
MSEYFDKKDLFLQPKTTQYGSHMVMTNVHKEKKSKFINVDTRFRDDYSYSQTANYTITLPERITDVKSIYITNIEIPNVLFNVSAVQKNNSFLLTKTASNNTKTSYTVTVPDNKYGNIYVLNSTLNYQLAQKSITDISFSYDGSYNKTKIGNSSGSNKYNLNFAVDSSGNYDKSLINSKLGWILGYRDISLNVSTSTSVYASALPDVFGPKYLFLAVDEFSNGNQRSFVSPLPRSTINKNILARISVNAAIYGFDSLISSNRYDGTLLSDRREYTGKVDLQKLNVQLLNEYGNPVCLNGLDFSFCMEVEHE